MHISFLFAKRYVSDILNLHSYYNQLWFIIIFVPAFMQIPKFLFVKRLLMYFFLLYEMWRLSLQSVHLLHNTGSPNRKTNIVLADLE